MDETKHILVQIYEVQTPGEAEAVIACGVDCIGGVVLSAGEWKNPVLREAVELVRQAGARSSLIPLFSRPDDVYRILEYYQPHVVHLCDTLDPIGAGASRINGLIHLQAGIRDRFEHIQIMRSIPVAQTGAAGSVDPVEAAALFEPVSDMFIIDTVLSADGTQQPVDGFVGITGKVCDWTAASQVVQSAGIPVILAGGLGPENVYEAILAVKPAGVDSCTGTNFRDGEGRPVRFKKDLQRVRRFASQARRAELQLN